MVKTRGRLVTIVTGPTVQGVAGLPVPVGEGGVKENVSILCFLKIDMNMTRDLLT